MLEYHLAKKYREEAEKSVVDAQKQMNMLFAKMYETCMKVIYPKEKIYTFYVAFEYDDHIELLAHRNGRVRGMKIEIPLIVLENNTFNEWLEEQRLEAEKQQKIKDQIEQTRLEARTEFFRQH